MAKMRIFEIARSLQAQIKDIKSTDLVKLLNENGFEAKGPNSNIEDEAIAFLLKTFKDMAGKQRKAKGAVTKKTVDNGAAKEKVVITEEKPKEEKEQEPVKEERDVAMKQTVKDVETESQKVKEPEKQAQTAHKDNVRHTEKQEYRRPVSDRTDHSDRKARQDGRGYRQTDGRSATGGRTDANNQNYKGSAGGNRSGGGYAGGTRTGGGYAGGTRTGSGYAGGNRSGGGYAGGTRTGGGYAGGTRTGGGYAGGTRTGGGYAGGTRTGGGYAGGNRSNAPASSGGRTDYKQGQGGRPQSSQQGAKAHDRFNKSQVAGFDAIKPEQKNSRNTRVTKSQATSKYNKKKNYEMESTKSIRDAAHKKKDPNRKGAFIKPVVVKQEEPEDSIKSIVIPEKLTIKELAEKMKLSAAALVKKLFLQGKMVSINHEITFEEAEEIALEYNCIAELEEKVDVIAELIKEDEENEELMEKRSPVVCVMGHVDHGKTSLLDAIRETNVISKEAGGITQHIGAYVVEANGEKITFLDTPGHEAFTSMRMRGAKSTDIAILVVAADDGVMPQTVEAISHAKAAGVEIIVAINKIDKQGANIERVKQELVEHELIAEDWGGSTVFVPVSAHTKEGINQLLEMIVLTAEVCELKANPNRQARGIVIEAQLDKGKGPVATILVQKGTLTVGDHIVIGSAYGKVRAMMDDRGRRVKSAGPSTPVEILGLNEVPDAGEIFMATTSDKEARSIAEAYIKQGREKLLEDTKTKLSLDGLFSQIKAGSIKDLNIVVKADVQGSVEAIKQNLIKLSNEEVAIRIIHGGVGTINESDVSLAIASNAIIIGFNVRTDNTAKEVVEREKVDLRLYRVIYNIMEDIEAAMKGMLEPVFEEKVIGHAEVRQVFKASGLGTIAGSYVLDGKILRNCLARIFRDDQKIFEGNLASLKRFKDDVKEVTVGYECGLVFERFNDIQEEDKVELYIMEEVAR